MEVFWVLLLVTALFVGIFSGVHVILAIAGAPLLIAAIASLFGAFDLGFLSAFPQRVIGIMNNPLLIAIPLFVLMGILLEQSRQAERMLLNITRLFGETRSTLGVAVILVSTMIAASTGIIGATIVMLGAIALPTLLKAGMPRETSAGLICASGTLGQIIPPSIVLILLGDQVSNAYLEAQQRVGNFAPDPVTVGDLFAGALLPGFILVGLYILYIVFRLSFGNDREQEKKPKSADLPAREVLALFLQMAPTLLLIVSVLGSILFGVATPTEAAAIGVAGTMLIAAASDDAISRNFRLIMLATTLSVISAFIFQRLGWSKIDLSGEEVLITGKNWLTIVVTILAVIGLLAAIAKLFRNGLLAPALTRSGQVSAMIFGIIIAASMLSLVFRGFHGERMVEDLLTSLPGDKWVMLAVTMLVIFILGFVLDFVEIIFIIIPIIGPVILQADIHPVWFAVLIALNIQTSFLTPPFGFALFYFRSVAPPEISTAMIYRSVVPFVLLQVITIALVAFVPSIATWLPNVIFN